MKLCSFAHTSLHLYNSSDMKAVKLTYSLVFQFPVHLLDRVGLVRLVVRHTGEPAVQVFIIITVIVVGIFSSLQTLCSGKTKAFLKRV